MFSDLPPLYWLTIEDIRDALTASDASTTLAEWGWLCFRLDDLQCNVLRDDMFAW